MSNLFVSYLRFLLGYCWEVLLLFRQNHIHLYLRDQGTKTFENMYAQIFSDLLIIYLAKAIIYKLLIITNSYFFLEMCMYVYFSFNLEPFHLLLHFSQLFTIAWRVFRYLSLTYNLRVQIKNKFP